MTAEIASLGDLQAFLRQEVDTVSFVHIIDQDAVGRVFVRDEAGQLKPQATISGGVPFLADLVAQSRPAGSEDRRILQYGDHARARECLVNIFRNNGSTCVAIDLRRYGLPTLTIDELGLNPASVAKLRSWSKAEEGLILVCGGIASGKSSTSDALLQLSADNSNRIVYRLDWPAGFTTPGVHLLPVNSISLREALDRVASADADVIGVANTDRSSAYPDAVCRAALDASRRGLLIILDLAATSPTEALSHLEAAVGEACWEDCVGLICQRRDGKGMLYDLLTGPKAPFEDE